MLTSKKRKSILDENRVLKSRIKGLKRKMIMESKEETLKEWLANEYPIGRWSNRGDVNYADHGGLQVRNNGDDLDLYNLSVAGYDGIAYLEEEGTVWVDDLFESKYNVTMDSKISDLSYDMFNKNVKDMDLPESFNIKGDDIKGVINGYISDVAGYYGLDSSDSTDYDEDIDGDFEETMEVLADNLKDAEMADC